MPQNRRQSVPMRTCTPCLRRAYNLRSPRAACGPCRPPAAGSATIGVRANWQLYAGGRLEGRVAETDAEARAAEARLRAARGQVEEQAITTFQGVRTAQLVASAASEQARASEQTRTSVAHEVRVGMKPQLALLDAEREALNATAQAVSAEATRAAIAYRLAAIIGSSR